MIPNYKDENCTIYNAHCDAVLPSLGRFDLLLTQAPQYPPGLTDDNKARIDSGLKVAGQSTLFGSLPEAGLQLAIEICANTIVWRTDRYAIPRGKTLDWGCNAHIATAWHNTSAHRMMYWSPVPKSERLRLFKQCMHITPHKHDAGPVHDSRRCSVCSNQTAEKVCRN